MKRPLFWILKLSVTSALLYAVFSLIPITETAGVLRRARPVFILSGLCVLLTARYVASFGTKMLTDAQRLDLSILEIFKINLASSFYGLALPGQLAGGAVKWYKMSKGENQPAQALATIFFDRLIDTLVMVILGTMLWLANLSVASDRGASAALFILLVGLFLTYFIAFRGDWSERMAMRLERTLFLPLRIREGLAKTCRAAAEFKALSRFEHTQLVFFYLARNMLAVFGFYFFARALDIDVSLWTIGWIRSVIVILQMLPIAFQGLGVREASFVALLKPYGVPGVEAVSLSLLVLMGSIAMAFLGGIFELTDRITTIRAVPLREKT